MHRAVHVARQVDQHPQGVALLRGRQPSVAQPLRELRHGAQQVARGVAGLRLGRAAVVDVEVMPRERGGIGRGMARLVHPVGLVDHRAAAQYAFDPLRGLGREVRLGDAGRDVVALLSPGARTADRGQAAGRKQQPSFHRRGSHQWFIVARNSSLLSVRLICLWRNSMASTGVMSERYLRSTHVRFITSRGSSRSSRRVPEAITSTAG